MAKKKVGGEIYTLAKLKEKTPKTWNNEWWKGGSEMDKNKVWSQFLKVAILVCVHPTYRYDDDSCAEEWDEDADENADDDDDDDGDSVSKSCTSITVLLRSGFSGDRRCINITAFVSLNWIFHTVLANVVKFRINRPCLISHSFVRPSLPALTIRLSSNCSDVTELSCAEICWTHS